MKVGIIQSNYVPWRGYFDFIEEVDFFVFHDDLQYTKGDWRNRNYIKGPTGIQRLTVPVHYLRNDQLIQDTEIDYSRDWVGKHRRILENAYKNAPYFPDMMALWLPVCEKRPRTISRLNLDLIFGICSHLGINTPMILSSILAPNGTKTDRIIDVCKKVGADTYVSGPAAKSYLDETALNRHGISLEWKSYAYDPYPQLFGDFIEIVSILDLIANCGPDSRALLKSRSGSAPA